MQKKLSTHIIRESSIFFSNYIDNNQLLLNFGKKFQQVPKHQKYKLSFV